MKSLASADVLMETKRRLQCVEAGDRALWGKMTAPQMVRHVGCAYEIALGDREVDAIKGTIPPRAMKWLALRSGVRWARNTPTTPELIAALDEEPNTSFEDLIRRAISGMEELAVGQRWRHEHPFFGTMSCEDWMRWGYLHADHHLRQFGR